MLTEFTQMQKYWKTEFSRIIKRLNKNNEMPTPYIAHSWSVA